MNWRVAFLTELVVAGTFASWNCYAFRHIMALVFFAVVVTAAATTAATAPQAAAAPSAAASALSVRCPRNCTALLQTALFSTADHIIVSGGHDTVVGARTHSTSLLANGTGMVVEFAPGFGLTGFLNYSTEYSAALVTLKISGSNITFRRQQAMAAGAGAGARGGMETAARTLF